MMPRHVKPEILDSLDHLDPAAVRSRKDLVMINTLMRGKHWIMQQLKKNSCLTRVVELGAGDGLLASRILRELPHLEVTAIDLTPRPAGLDERIVWRQEDVMSVEVPCDRQTVVIANLFLHHFEQNQLHDIAKKWKGAGHYLFSEPYRSTFFSVTSRVLFPLINHVTRHDMVVSINAGFQMGELPAMFGDGVEWSESRGLFGGLRSKGMLA